MTGRQTVTTRRVDAGRRSMVIELEALRARLEETEATLSAIRSGQVDALVVCGEAGEKIYTLQGAETPYRVLIEAMSEGAVTVDGLGTILYANRRFAELVGQPLERVVGSTLWVYEDPGAPKLREIIQRVEASQGSSVAGELALADGNGGTIPVHVSGCRLPEDQQARYCMVVTDLRDQKLSEELRKAEEEARQHRDLAERRAAELARSNADLESFAYIASHDLKEPLRGMGSLAAFILEDYGERLDGEGRERVGKLVSLSRRAHDLLDSLLEYARVGRMPAHVHDVDLGVMAQEAAATLEPLIRERGAVVEIEPGLPNVRCDRTRIPQLFTNLFSNALKYNTSEAPRVSVRLVDVPGTGPAVCVRDNGIGIEERHWGPIFEMFRRLHGPDRYGGGTGIGLAIVKKIVEQHGGRAWVRSTPGEGSSFYFTLWAPGSR
jgi:PAS domain S-box-containing protein